MAKKKKSKLIKFSELSPEKQAIVRAQIAGLLAYMRRGLNERMEDPRTPHS